MNPDDYCPGCGGDGYPLGGDGDMLCRSCGMEYPTEAAQLVRDAERETARLAGRA